MAFATAALAWFDNAPAGGSDDGPLWREIAGLVVSALAVVVLAGALVVQWRGNRRRMAWSSPLVALTRSQRKELWHQVRDDGDVPPERLPLARHLAESIAGQGVVLVLNLGVVLLWTGQLISAPSLWRLGLVAVYGTLTAASAPWILRKQRRARRFLADHPAPSAPHEPPASRRSGTV